MDGRPKSRRAADSLALFGIFLKGGHRHDRMMKLLSGRLPTDRGDEPDDETATMTHLPSIFYSQLPVFTLLHLALRR